MWRPVPQGSPFLLGASSDFFWGDFWVARQLKKTASPGLCLSYPFPFPTGQSKRARDPKNQAKTASRSCHFAILSFSSFSSH